MKTVFRKIKLLFTEQSGVAKILVAFSMVMLMGFTALVVDAGGLFLEKSRLQKALDSAVLGGAQLLKVSESDAVETAIKLGSSNGFPISGEDVETGPNFIEIDKKVNKELFFARVLRFDNTDVRAIARAETLPLISGEGIIPVALEEEEYEPGEPYTMHFQTGKPGKGNEDDEDEDNSSISGNFGFLAIDGPGGKDLKEGIMYGATREVNEEFEMTKTGLSWGNVRAAFEYRIKQDEGVEKCQSPETADRTCSRVVTVPIVKTFEDAHGKSMVKIVGFAAFWIEKVDPNGKDKKVVGRFIDHDRAGEFGEGEDFGISGVKLVK